MTRFSLLTVLVALGLASCAEIPSDDPTAKQLAYRSAQQSAETPHPPGLDSRARLFGDAVDSNVSTRLGALEVVDQYNSVLVALAEGKSDQDVRSAVGAFSDGLSALLTTAGPSIPALGAITGKAQTIAGLAENARRRAEFEHVVDEGAPVVQRIIDEVLVKDGEDFYDIGSSLADRRSRLLRRSAGETARTASLISARYRNPPADSALASSRTTAQQRLRNAMGQVGSQAKTFSLAGQPDRRLFDLSGLTSSGPSYTELAQVRIDRLVESAEALGSKYRKVVDDSARFHARLGSTVQSVN